MVHREDLRSGGDHLLPLLHDQGGGHVGLLGDGVGGQPPLLADLQERLVGVGVGDGVRALAALDLALERYASCICELRSHVETILKQSYTSSVDRKTVI